MVARAVGKHVEHRQAEARRFHDVVDTEAIFFRLLEDSRREQVIP